MGEKSGNFLRNLKNGFCAGGMGRITSWWGLGCLGIGGISAIRILANQRRRGQWEFNSSLNFWSWQRQLLCLGDAGHDYNNG